MILYLVQILNFDFPGINLFTYLSFRAGCAIITSLLIVLLIGPKFIKSMLIKQGNGQPIREDGPKSHLHSKKGTPSMGGLLILSSFLISTLIWGDIFNSFMWIVILSTILFLYFSMTETDSSLFLNMNYHYKFQNRLPI